MDISVNIEDMKQIMYTDQRGQFPIVSSQGNRYIMVLCETDGNLILVEPMKNRTSSEMSRTYKKLMQGLNNNGIKIKKHILKNEASGKYLKTI